MRGERGKDRRHSRKVGGEEGSVDFSLKTDVFETSPRILMVRGLGKNKYFQSFTGERRLWADSGGGENLESHLHT